MKVDCLYEFLDEIKDIIGQSTGTDGEAQFDGTRIKVALDFTKCGANPLPLGMGI